MVTATGPLGLDRVLGHLRGHTQPLTRARAGRGLWPGWEWPGPTLSSRPSRPGSVCGRWNLASPCTPPTLAARGPLFPLGGQPTTPKGSPQTQGSAQTREPRPLAGQVGMGTEESQVHLEFTGN